MGKLKEWIDKAEKLSSRKKAQYILIVILLAVILAIYFSTLAQPRENTGGTDAARLLSPDRIWRTEWKKPFLPLTEQEM